MQTFLTLIIILCCICNLTGNCSTESIGKNQVLNTRKNQERIAKVLLERILTALQKGIDFYYEVYQSLIFDAAITLFRVAGQCEVLINHIENGTYSGVPLDVKPRLMTLMDNATHVGNLTQPYIAQTKPRYEALKKWVQRGLWNNLDHGNRVTDADLLTDALYGFDQFLDIRWADCYINIFSDECEETKYCMENMYAPGFTYYSITHQLLYLIAGEGSGCFKGERLQENNWYAKLFCSNMLWDAEDIYKHNFEDGLEDLWMEMQNFCGIVGFQDFFRYDWLRQILEWQWPQGCWGDGSPSDHRRVKRTEKELKYGCKAHRTGQALSSLIQYVRYLLDFLYKQGVRPPIQFFPQTEYIGTAGVLKD